jgi:L-lactate dehydrogenase
MKNNDGRRIALIGCGLVGMSFIYSAVNQGLGNEYILIDVLNDIASGNAMDIEDSSSCLPHQFNTIKAGTYKDLVDCDILVITAGRSQRPNETRQEMVKDNAKIIKEIALNVRSSGFQGITIVCSNPVDTLTYVFWKVTDFDKSKIIGSGTVLDSSRFKKLLSNQLNISERSIFASIIGEHGDSSVAVFSSASIYNENLADYSKKNKIKWTDLTSLHRQVIERAYEIIKTKKSTYYGIGAAVSKITRAIINNEKIVLPVGIILDGEMGYRNLCFSLPCVIGSSGIEKLIPPTLNNEEKILLDESSNKVKQNIEIAMCA